MHVVCAEAQNPQLSIEVPFACYQAAASLIEILPQLDPVPGSILLIGMPAEVIAAALPEPNLLEHAVHSASDATKLPFRDNEFDCVIACDTLDLLPDRARKPFLGELQRASSGFVIVLGPFASDVVSSAEESINEIHKVAANAPQDTVLKHLEEGLPDIKVTRAVLTPPKGASPLVIPHTSLRSWALLQMLTCVADTSDRTRVMFTKLNAFYNYRLARIDHAPPVYRHLLIATKSTAGLDATLVRQLKARFADHAREEEMETVRGLLRIALDSYAEALAVPPPKGVLSKAMQRVEELERKVRSQARTIEKLQEELNAAKPPAAKKKPGRLLKKLFTF